MICTAKAGVPYHLLRKIQSHHMSTFGCKTTRGKTVSTGNIKDMLALF
jgi:hypothetical protein